MTIEKHFKWVRINHNPNGPGIPDNPYRILAIGCLESRKTDVFLNLVKHHRPDIDKIIDKPL